MAVFLTAVVEHPVDAKRYAVELTVDVEEEESMSPCFWCDCYQARCVVIIATRVWRYNNGVVYPSLLKRMDIVYETEERLGAGRPVCIRCWDSELLPYVRDRALSV